MRIKLITTILFTCVLSACQPQATTENSKNNAASTTNPAKAVASGDMASVKKNIQAALEQAYPEQKVQIKSVDGDIGHLRDFMFQFFTEWTIWIAEYRYFVLTIATHFFDG